MENQLLKCGEYTRISKEDRTKNEESSSISSQKMIIKSFAKFNNFNIIESYTDDGFTGSDFDRPGFKKMMEDIEQGKINCVITKDLSRLGREMYKTGGLIEDYFIEHDIRYIAINDSYDSQFGDEMLGLRLGVNDLYLRDVSKKVKNSMRAKQQLGKYIGSFPCYGYIKDPKDKHKLIPDERVVSIVKLMYELALEGHGPTTICNKLSEMKIPIPIVHKKDPRGKLVTENDGYGIWKHATVKNILTSQMYIGNMVQHTFEKLSFRSKKLRKVKAKDIIIVENTHEAIVSKEDFEKVQKLLKNRSKFLTLKEKKYVFTGLLKCKECGATLSISKKTTKSNNSHHTQCNTYRKKGKLGFCTQHRLNYNWLEEDLLTIIREICSKHLKEYNYEELAIKSNEIYNRNLEELKFDLKNLNNNLIKNGSIIDSLYEDKIAKLISDDDFKRMYQKYSDKVNIIKNKKIACEEKIKKFKIKMDNIDYEGCKKLTEEFMCVKNPTNSIISRLVKKIEISESKEVDIYFNFRELSCIEK